MTTYRIVTAKQVFIGDFKSMEDAWKEVDKTLKIPVIFIQEIEDQIEEKQYATKAKR